MSQVLVGGGKEGSQLREVRAVVEETINKSLNDVAKASQPNMDDGERVPSQTAGQASNRVVEFLRQPFPAKKWSISKESDTAFLHDVEKITKSENVRALVQQRLAELGS